MKPPRWAEEGYTPPPRNKRHVPSRASVKMMASKSSTEPEKKEGFSHDKVCASNFPPAFAGN
jgi:hypothetical protein